MDNEKPTLSLIFSAEAQDTVIGYLMTNSQFFLQCLTKISPRFFNDPKNTVIYSIQLNRFNATKKMPPIGDIINDPLVYSSFTTDEKRKQFVNHVHKCELLAKNQNNSLDFIKSRITGWMQGMLFKEMSAPAVTAYNSGNVDRAFEYIHALETKKRETLFEDNGRILFSGYSSYLQEAEIQFQNALPTGFSLLDEALLGPGAPGGLLKGDMTLVMAPTDAGKTTTLMTMIAHNILRNNSVLFMSHEGVPIDLRIRLLCGILTIQNLKRLKIGEIKTGEEWVDKLTLFKMNKTEEGRKRIEHIVNLMDKKLIYYPYNKPGMSIEDVEPIIRRLQETWASDHEGNGFDLLVSDYPAKLCTKMASHGSLPPHLAAQRVYDYYVQMAIEYNFHAVTAIQTNREGFKVNQGRKGFENRLLTPDDVAGSYDTTCLATNIITVNREPDAQLKERMTLNICKAKNSTTGRAVVCRTKFGCRVSHDDNLGGFAYNGQDKMTAHIDAMLQNSGFNNRLVDPTEIIDFKNGDKGVIDANNE